MVLLVWKHLSKSWSQHFHAAILEQAARLTHHGIESRGIANVRLPPNLDGPREHKSWTPTTNKIDDYRVNPFNALILFGQQRISRLPHYVFIFSQCRVCLSSCERACVITAIHHLHHRVHVCVWSKRTWGVSTERFARSSLHHWSRLPNASTLRNCLRSTRSRQL